MTDVVVYAATSGGVCAAVAAARAGASVVLLEPGRHVGGMTSGGLGYTDIGDVRVVGGMAGDLRRAIADWYGVAEGHYAGPEPHVAEAIYLRWLEEAGVDVRFGAALTAADADGGVIRSVELADGSPVTGAVFVDASYEGDLLAAAGVPHALGREDRSLYGERYAGRQELVPGRHTVPPWISPFAGDVSGAAGGEVLPQLHDRPLADVGTGDGGVMSYGYRVCLSQAADRVPFERRDGYDDAYWELGRRIFDQWRRDGVEVRAGQLLGLEKNLPNDKCDGNSIGPFSLSVLDGSAWAYPEAGPAERERIRLHHVHHARDFLYFLSHDPAVPASVREEMQAWGYAADEFADTGHLPHQLYVREARRMLGEYVLTEHDLLPAARPQHDVVAMGSYHIDVREVQRTWRWVAEHPRPVGMVFTEGYLSVPVQPYPIPYRALVPRYADCTNLLVPVCLSASHVAFASVRMEVQYQMLGHAAGLAAVEAARTVRPVQSIDVSRVQDALRDAGQVLAL
ncbi:FAD-dependent oxidoreductase [Jiangella aurantiaca]|uniref:FAD-dependent oxidoreductase n=1 Tax=Jiangella aurantiaca TaxID=2530373 RepID=A0A4R5AHY6_9ACTN|nr:FAD-dependent oxidoreductase [Jiangella aurantiaca]TDD72328.1 FAD-dependent oxidoreductase [Jiangella aurantiaca]